MRKVVFRFRKDSRNVFEAVKSGKKAVETRAATRKFKDLKAGDIAVLVRGKEKLEKTIKSSRHFPGLESLFANIEYKKISPFANSVDEAREMYNHFPDYSRKIAKYGIIALELG